VDEAKKKIEKKIEEDKGKGKGEGEEGEGEEGEDEEPLCEKDEVVVGWDETTEEPICDICPTGTTKLNGFECNCAGTDILSLVHDETTGEDEYKCVSCPDTFTPMKGKRGENTCKGCDEGLMFDNDLGYCVCPFFGAE